MDTAGLHSGQFRATQQWKELLRHILAQSAAPSRRSGSSQDPRQQEDSVRCNGKSLQSAISGFLSKNLDSKQQPHPEADAAARLCQQLLDSGAIISDCGQRFEAKSSRWYRLNSSSPCILPFLDFIGQLADAAGSGSQQQQVQQQRKTPITSRLQRSFGRALESRQRKFRHQLARMSCRVQHSRSWSSMPTAASAAVDIDDQQCLPASVDCRDRPVSAVEKIIRNDFYSCHGGPAASLDFYIHQLCLHRLLRTIDLPIIDELVHTDKLSQLSQHPSGDFLNLDDSFGGVSEPRRPIISHHQHQQQQRLQQQQEAKFLASQLTRSLNCLSALGGTAAQLDTEACLQRLLQLLAKSPDPLGWRRLVHVFQVLLCQPVARNSRPQCNTKVLQLSFCLLSLQQRQQSENLLSFIRCCCQSNARSQRAAALVPQLAELLIPEAASQSTLPTTAYRQRLHRLFAEMLDKCEQLFRVPSDIFHKARLMRMRRYQPELLAQTVFCYQLSREEHRRVTKEVTESAVKDLMQNLLNDPKVSSKEKQSKLRLLRLHHADIYEKYFSSYKF